MTVPTITLEGDANGAPATGGVGHNLPQEAPAAFAQAIMDIDQ